MSDEFKEELLGAFRASRGPESGRLERNWAALQTAAPAGSAASHGVRWIPRLLVGGAGTIALAWAVWPTAPGPRPTPSATNSSAPAVASTESPQTPATSPVRRPTPAAAPVPKSDVTENHNVGVPDEPALDAEPHPVPTPRRRPTHSKVESVDSAGSSLADEVALIARAKGELSRGDASAALRTTRDHQRRFPAGRLVDEGKLLRMSALCGTGQEAKARKEVQRFLAAKPSSALSDRVRNVCPE